MSYEERQELSEMLERYGRACRISFQAKTPDEHKEAYDLNNRASAAIFALFSKEYPSEQSATRARIKALESQLSRVLKMIEAICKEDAGFVTWELSFNEIDNYMKAQQLPLVTARAAEMEACLLRLYIAVGQYGMRIDGPEEKEAALREAGMLLNPTQAEAGN